MKDKPKVNDSGMFATEGGIEGQRSSETTDPQAVSPAGLENGNHVFISHSDGYLGDQPYSGGPKGLS